MTCLAYLSNPLPSFQLPKPSKHRSYDHDSNQQLTDKSFHDIQRAVRGAYEGGDHPSNFIYQA